MASVLALVGLSAGGSLAAQEPGTSRFVSRPDLRPPVVETSGGPTAPGYLFLSPAAGLGATPPDGAQNGPLIVDNSGEPVWFAPTSPARSGDSTGLATDLKVQEYRGQPVLTYWRGDVTIPPGRGAGEYVVLDNSYREIATVQAGSGLAGDLHEFVITPQDTALLTSYHTVEGPNGPVVEGVVQEVDIASGEVLFEWRSLQHVPVSESMLAPPADPSVPFDYFHINSVDVDSDGNLLVSARSTHTVYKIDRDTGEVIWRLGGKASDFEMGPGAGFAWQHDARRLPDGTISLFDNRAPGDGPSRAIVLRLDEQARTAELVREYPRPDGGVSITQGNAQALPGGHLLIGGGSDPYVAEFDESGEVVFEARFSPGMESYRAYRFPWTATPFYPPVAVTTPGPDDGMTVHASWNGATEVARWRVLAGPDPQSLEPVTEAPRSGFETAIELDTRQPAVVVQALDAEGNVLGTSVSAPQGTPGRSAGTGAIEDTLGLLDVPGRG